ncbi:MAG: NADPH-dependent F420 reductase [Dehalococcoidia bacterium]
MPQVIALIGGTGAEGRGLALRFAAAGHEVVLGSRDGARAAEAAAELTTTLSAAGIAATVRGAENADAATQASIVVIVVPYEAHQPTLEALAPALAGKVVVDAVVPMRFERGPRPVEVAEGSATEQAAALLPASTVVGAFHNVAAAALADLSETLHQDVLITADDAEAKAAVSALVTSVPGLRAVDAGPLRYARFVEGITLLLVGINIRYKAHAGVRIDGLPERAP